MIVNYEEIYKQLISDNDVRDALKDILETVTIINNKLENNKYIPVERSNFKMYYIKKVITAFLEGDYKKAYLLSPELEIDIMNVNVWFHLFENRYTCIKKDINKINELLEKIHPLLETIGII